MSLIVTGMTQFVKAEGFNLIVRALCDANTAKVANVIPGMKGSGLVPYLSGTVALTAGGSCGTFTGGGTTTFSEVNVTVKPMLYEEALCIGALESKELIYQVNGSSYDSMPFPQIILEDKVKLIQNSIDELLWLGDISGSADPIDGFLVTAGDNSLLTTVTGATGSTAFTQVDELIDAAIAADCSYATAQDVYIFMSSTKYRAYIKDSILKNYFHYNPNDINTEGFTHPGSNAKIRVTVGLEGDSYIYLAKASDLHIGTNLQSDAEAITVFYNFPTKELYLRSQFYLGVGVSGTIFKR